MMLMQMQIKPKVKIELMNTSPNNQQISFIKIYQNEMMIIHLKMPTIRMINKNQNIKDFHNKKCKNIIMNRNSLQINKGKVIQDKDRNTLFKNNKVNNKIQEKMKIHIDRKNSISSEKMTRKNMKKGKIQLKRRIMIQKKKVEIFMIKKKKEIVMKIASMIEILIR